MHNSILFTNGKFRKLGIYPNLTLASACGVYVTVFHLDAFLFLPPPLTFINSKQFQPRSLFLTRIIKKFIHKVFPSQDSPAKQPHPAPSQDRTPSFQSGCGAHSSTQQTLNAPPGSLNIALKNYTSSNTVFAYATGLALNDNNAPVLLQSDGKILYYLQSPSSTCAPLSVNCAIPLGAFSLTVIDTIPKIAGGGIWFSIDEPLAFLVNLGLALVEPSVTNYSDPNINISWAFCEFTYNDAQLFANITYVDLVSMPVSLTLTNTSGGTQYVARMPSNGLATVYNDLSKQAAVDN